MVNINRREYTLAISSIAVGSMTTLAGCSSVSGPSGEVIKNEFTNVEVSESTNRKHRSIGNKGSPSQIRT
jgi:hypothetical protein